MYKKVVLTVIIVSVILGFGGCIKFKSSETKVTDLGGVFFTDDRFETWHTKSLLMTPGEQPGSISNTDVYFMKFDPSDDQTIYTGTRADGLFYSYNSGQGWNKLKNLPTGFVRDMAIDPENKCRLYAAVHTRIFKSEDCGRTWKKIFYSDNPEIKISSMDIDWYSPEVLYAGLTDGTLLKTVNRGESWSLSKKFENRVHKIMVDPYDTRVVYAGILEKGLFRTDDKGENWLDLNKAMDDYKNADEFYDFSLSKSRRDMIIYANDYGVLRSYDKGQTWMPIELVTQPGEERIYSVEIDPQSENYIYYSTDEAVYKSIDGGDSWVVKKTPTTRVVGEFLIHPKDGSKVYVGVKQMKK